MATPETAWFRLEGGVVQEMDLPLAEGIEQRVRSGAILRVNGPDGDPYVATEDAPVVPAPPSERPATNAPKADWVGWAVNHPDEARRLPAADAEAMTKTDLIDLYKD